MGEKFESGKLPEPDCIRLSGLDESDLAASSGFTRRAWAALAHLREAWIAADPDNARAIERAIAALFDGHSFSENRETVDQILRAHHDRGAEFFAGIRAAMAPQERQPHGSR